MNREQILKILSQIEQELPVYDWKINDIDIWPILKWNIFLGLTNLKKQRSSEDEKINLKDRVKKFVIDNINLLNSIRHITLLYFLPKSEALFLSAKTYRVNFNEQFINRYYEPLKKEHTSYTFIELAKEKHTNYAENKLIDLGAFKAYIRFKRKYFNSNIIENLKDFEKLSMILPEELDLQLLKPELIKHTIDIQELISIYKILLSKTKPKVIYSLCYYINEYHAFYYLANKLNIPSYDIQHGGQGYLHPMYTFYDFPKYNKLNTLPQKFWVWDQNSYDHLKSWLPSTNLNYQIEKKGNPWWKFALQNFKNKIAFSDKNIILYTIQFESIDDYILDAIDKTPDKYIWFLRTHPRKPQGKEIILNQLEKRNLLDKANLELATDLPLPLLLKKACIHISKFSGSIIEADQLGVKTIILENIGIENYADIIERGNAIGVENPNGDLIVENILKHDSCTIS